MSAQPHENATAMSAPLLFKGAQGSPYTRKMLALLRYRHIPYRYLQGLDADRAGMPKPKVELLPTFYLPDAAGTLEAVTDSTPLLRRFERDFCGRSAVPADPVLRFIDSVLEDFADEWVTKAMFHYRWYFADGIDKASDIVPLQFMGICMPPAQLEQVSKQFSQRQTDRLTVIGLTPDTAPLIEASYARLLDLLDAHLQHYPFLMGHRPGAADFALYGQLTQLALFDPASAAITLQRSHRVYAWTGMLEDLSGLQPQEDQWLGIDALPATLTALLQEVGRCYVPLLLANARALMANEKQVHARIDGGDFSLQVVPYQGKCLRWLREEFAALATKDQDTASKILQATGCIALITEKI